MLLIVVNGTGVYILTGIKEDIRMLREDHVTREEIRKLYGELDRVRNIQADRGGKFAYLEGEAKLGTSERQALQERIGRLERLILEKPAR